MKIKTIILMILIFYSLTQMTDNITRISEKYKFNAVYRIDSLINGYSLIVKNDKLKFIEIKEGKEESFRIISTKSNLYFIESKPFNQRLGVNDKEEIILFNKYNSEKLEEIYWKIIPINDKEFLIQNNRTKKFLQIDGEIPKCSKNFSEITNDTMSITDALNIFRFSFFKLCEEVELKPEYIEIIEKEPVDVVIKYIDLSDKDLKREGIIQIKKDEDNEELKYSVRSIFLNIPWVRKIFIIMPNERVKYFQPIEQIRDKFVYVKDKDLIGFDSANSNVFQYNLYNLTKFGISDNFILMDDDCFFGRPIKKTEFFYYDETEKKVLPSVVTDDFSELIEKNVLKEYKRVYFKGSKQLHSFFGWKLSQLSAFKLLLEQFQPPLINAGFNHNSIPLNINDMKEIYEFILNKYPNANQTLYSKGRTIYDLQSQSLFNSYLLNIKKRKVNSIPWTYFDLGALEGKNFDIEMFVINTSGDRIYKKSDYKYAKLILESKFSKPTPYETILEEVTSNLMNNNTFNEKPNYLINKMNETFKKLNESYNTLNEDYQKMKENHEKIIENYQKINETFQQKNNELNDKVENLGNQIKEISQNKNEYIIKSNNNDLEKKYDDLFFYFIIVIIILIISLFINIIILICIICNKKDNNEKYKIVNSSLDLEKEQIYSHHKEENMN